MSEAKQQQVSRRRLFAGAGAVGALAGAAALMPRIEPAAPQAEAAKPAPETGGGYQLTAHVKRYYQTAKV